MDHFKGKTAIVTGGSTGIGRATAIAFAKEGAKVVIADVQAEEAQNTLEIIWKIGGKGIFVKTDVSKPREVEFLIQKTVESYGRLDFAFNNAGIGGVRANVADVKEEDWDRLMSINLKGIFLSMKYEIPQMLRQGGGCIVNTASTGGLIGVPGSSAYITAKHGVIGLTKTAALEYARSGIRINAVCPHVIRTPMTEVGFAGRPEFEQSLTDSIPLGRVGQPDDVAGGVLWLCSLAASFVTGSSLVLDGGFTIQ